MGIESVSGSNKPTLAPLDQDLQLGSTTGTKGTGRKDELTPEETAALLQVLQQFDNGLNKNATNGVPPPDKGGRTEGVGNMDRALDDAHSNLATDIYQFMAMYTKIAQQMRATAREQRQDQLQSQVASLNTAADKMVEAAEKRFSAALVQGITQIVGGAVSIASGAYSLKQIASAGKPQVDLAKLKGWKNQVVLPESPPPSKGGSPLPEGFSRPRSNAMTSETAVKPNVTTSTPHSPATDAFAPGSKFSQQLMARQSLFSGSGQFISGSGGMISAGFERDASLKDAESKEEEAKGTQAQAEREVQQDIVQTMGDLLRDIREQLRAMAQAEVDSNKGMARNI
jgi:hypothetical protein